MANYRNFHDNSELDKYTFLCRQLPKTTLRDIICYVYQKFMWGYLSRIQTMLIEDMLLRYVRDTAILFSYNILHKDYGIILDE